MTVFLACTNVRLESFNIIHAKYISMLIILAIHLSCMTYLSENIKHLRKEQSWTQGLLAERLGLKRSQIGSYEEGRAEPKISTLQKISALFQRSIDDLIHLDLKLSGGSDYQGRGLRILPIPVTPDDREQISVVPVHAQAGYLSGYGDPEYIEELPSFSLPLKELPPDGSYRLFQIQGDSMLPVQPGSYIISRYIQDWTDIQDGKCYIVITREEGVVYKRVWKQSDSNTLLLKSDNQDYAPYELKLDSLVELWQARAVINFQLPEEYDPQQKDLQQISQMINILQQDMKQIKTQLIVDG